HVPADGLALAVGVGCDDDLVGLARGVLQALDGILLSRNDLVLWLEGLLVVADRLFREVADVAGRSRDAVLRTQEAADGPGFGGRLDNDKLRHYSASPARGSRDPSATLARSEGGVPALCYVCPSI